MKATLNELMQTHNQRQWQDFLEQFSLVAEWVDRDFPDVDFNVEFNDDQTSGLLRIKVRLMTKKYMDPLYEDQLLKKTELRINEKMWNNPKLMRDYIKQIVPMFKKYITIEVNRWYQRRKLKAHS